MAVHSKIALSFVVVGLLSIGVWKIVEPMLAESAQNEASDAGVNGSIDIAVDGWIGYYPLCSSEIKKRLNRAGYGLRCVDDKADYADRYMKLKRNQYDFAVGTVDSYILNGEDVSYPGPIVAVIDESKGGDAIVARKSAIANLDALKSATKLKVAFTENSPSHHLLKSVASHFAVKSFQDESNFILSDGSSAALEELKSGKADIGILWEPDVSKALKDDEFVRLLGTEDTKRLIVDVLIASQNAAQDKPEMVKALLKAYFATLKHYKLNKDDLISDIAKHYREKESIAAALLEGVAWANLSDNAELWYDVSSTPDSEQGLVDTIESVIMVLLDNGDFKRNPLPNEDSYSLINSTFISDLYKKYAHAGGFITPGENKKGSVSSFKQLSGNEWDNLREVGSLKARKITFTSGTDKLTLDGKKQLDGLMGDLKHYPNFRIEPRGHSGTRGDKVANQLLSEDRAEAVMRYLNITHSMDGNRVRAVGFGGSKPLQRESGESQRSYNYRLPRVEIALLREEL
jgi:outer membrane protein OmpA-like peptidoglycan-associated protein/ABC-type nitrate/sulfonate/bicarbonate transport system substrate-binding protein